MKKLCPTMADPNARAVDKRAGIHNSRLRRVFVTKARTGAFRGGGSMPPFSREALVDDDLAGILGDFAL